MIDCRCRSCLSVKSPERYGIVCHLRRDELEGNLATKAGVYGAEDTPHPAPTERNGRDNEEVSEMFTQGRLAHGEQQ